MRRKATAIAGLVCGVLCALCVGLYTDSVRGQADQARAEALDRYGGDQLEVVVAKRDMAAGESVDGSSIETRLWVADLLPEGSLVSYEQVEGRTLATPVLAGEVLNEKRFAGESKRLEVPDGLIAVSVPAKDVQAVGGAIRPGSRVDMYATGGTSTDLLVQGVLVLATSNDKSAEPSEESVSWITVAISPNLAQGIVAAAQKMELYFTLPGEDVLSSDEYDLLDESGSEEVDGGEGSNRAGATDGNDESGSDNAAEVVAEQAEIDMLLRQDDRRG